MPPPHVEAVQPAVPDRAADDAQRWFAQRMDFQLEVARRMMSVTELDDATLNAWVAQGLAKSFADIVDSTDADGAEIRRLIVEDRAAALERVRQRMLH